MKCLICECGETEPGTTTVTLTRGETTIVTREVPAQIRSICGEDYVDAATGERLTFSNCRNRFERRRPGRCTRL
jgi:YgiT-type zinc finger domain-containing protein